MEEEGRFKNAQMFPGCKYQLLSTSIFSDCNDNEYEHIILQFTAGHIIYYR